jgi:acyl-CoA synthetase (AMP-forming)/AMP-acid ligase II
MLECVKTGEVLAIQIGNHPDWPSLFLACLRARIVVLPLELTISAEQRERAFVTCRVAAIATLAPSFGAKPRGPVEVGVKVLPPNSSIPRRCARNNWNGRQPSLLKLTSGTTAAPRAIKFRSEQLLADCENICDTMGFGAADLNFGVIPISHSYGFSNLLTPLLARGVALALSSDRMPRAMVDGLAATRATVFPGMPVFYQSVCELEKLPPLPKLRLCISAGAPLSADVAERFRAKFGRAIHSFYGSSECGGICYTRSPRAIAGFVGEAMERVTIEPATPNGTSSLIRVRSAAVGDGYFPEPDESRLGGGIFIPDDLLEKVEAGYRIVGRASDLINVAGKKVNPAEIEAELLRCSGVREAIVFGRESARRNQEIAACVVTASGVTEAELLAHCRKRLSSWQTPRYIFFIAQIPVNERGKISRRELAERYRGL